jgi:hypothetical protein
MNIWNTLSECGGRSKKKVDIPKEDEGISQSKLGAMGMMGEWMTTRA